MSRGTVFQSMFFYKKKSIEGIYDYKEYQEDSGSDRNRKTKYEQYTICKDKRPFSVVRIIDFRKY